MQMAFTVMPGDNRVPMRNNHWLDALGRLKPGATAAQAAAELTGGTNQIASAAGRDGGRPHDASRRSGDRRAARSPCSVRCCSCSWRWSRSCCSSRARISRTCCSRARPRAGANSPCGCRSAAARARLIRQLLTEALLLVAVAALAAVVAQRWTSGLLMWFVPPTDLPISLETPLDFRVALFAATVAFASALIFGVAPALSASRTDLAEFLKSDRGQVGRGGAAPPQRAGRRAGGVLAPAPRLGRTVRPQPPERARVRSRLQAGPRAAPRPSISSPRGTTARVARRCSIEILDDIRALPGVESATLARRVPLGISTGNSSTSLEPEGYSAPQDDPAWSYLNWVGPDYFRTMGIPVVAGREFTTADRPDQPEVLVINRTFARRYWPDANPIGKRIRLGKTWYDVVGVVADSKYRRLNEPASPFVYLSTTWNYRPDVVFHVRTTGDPRLLAEPVRAIIHRADAKLPVFGPVTLEEHIQSASFQQRLGASLLSAFGALAVLLASIGLYATIAYSVSRRTRELGARLAMGATRARHHATRARLRPCA